MDLYAVQEPKYWCVRYHRDWVSVDFDGSTL